ncbi:hypothetical protein GCM10025876_06130 [Demequina litorisediminis]|uniref:Uncharacterized protein n=1 Tax=Demequina litorisediminis TaxID=1849022 RepID=A0ABQ6ICE0_9MICO|nr:hypothetical protein GCM10025876_06130 [Demequina litorisediminis]
MAPTDGYDRLVLDALEAVRRGEVQAVGPLLDLRAELLQDVEVEVDGTVADAAAAQVGDDRLADAVQQGSAQEDRDAARAGMLGDLERVGRGEVARVGVKDAGLDVVVHGGAVEAQQGGHHLDVADLRHVAQRGRGGAKEGGDHRLGDEVLGTAHVDLATERAPAMDTDGVGHGVHLPLPRGPHPPGTRAAPWQDRFP